MHVALPTMIGSLLGAGLTAALAWDCWRHPIEQAQPRQDINSEPVRR
ncbi:MAG TPA: hypothetical protein VFX52_11050 [Nocardioidaceae bacterium]|nr:hypothetical protein [Nocardioidaceae bacterium]